MEESALYVGLGRHGGGRVEPPGQGRRSRLTCPPTDLREVGAWYLNPQKVGIKE